MVCIDETRNPTLKTINKGVILISSVISQWKSVVFWVGAVLVIVLATFLYQPAAAKTGSLLVWTRNRVYVMDIDTLTLARVGPATSEQVIAPSPGCFGYVDTPCWVLIGDVVYYVDLTVGGNHAAYAQLPIDAGFGWENAPVSWSPDGLHLAYSVTDTQNGQSELLVYDVSSNEVKVRATDIDPSVTVAWSSGCAASLEAVDCELGYKKVPAQIGNELLPSLVGYTPAAGKTREWIVPTTEPIFQLRWSPDGELLLYSQPKRYFKRAEDNVPAYKLPPGGRLANMSPDARFTVYYQPFTLSDCQGQVEVDDCLHLGVWITSENSNDEPDLVYSVNLSQAQTEGGLNFIPTWSPDGNAFVFFQEGQLIYYDLSKREATIWYKPVTGKLRSVPVFSPNEEAVAFVDNQGQGFSEYRLVVVNPRLQPIEEIIQTNEGFRILAWLPN